MTDKTDNKDASASKPEKPAYQRFGETKLVPPPAPIAQLNDEEKFPLFLGVGIAISIVALISVFVLAFMSHKTKVNTPPAGGASASASASAGLAAGSSPRSSTTGTH